MMKNTKTPPPDAWLALVLQSMTLAELEAEAANAANSAAEQAAMRAELQRRRGAALRDRLRRSL